MNRLYHLRQTLLVNIENNLSYPNIEFILLNYGSTDELDTWVRNHLMEYIELGIVKYLNVDNTPYFNRSHARNIVFNNATGDIICNPDADCFIGKDFALHVNKIFFTTKHSFLVAFNSDNQKYTEAHLGRICCRKEDFHKIRGFDESIGSYGNSEIDFINRLIGTGLSKIRLTDPKFLVKVNHENIDRVRYERLYVEMHAIYLEFIDIDKTKLFFLSKEDNTFLEFNVDESTEEMQIIHKGKFFERDNFFLFRNNENEYFVFRKDNDCIFSYNGELKKVDNSRIINKIVLLICKNLNDRIIEERNKNGYKINPAGYGKARIRLNFNQMLKT